MRLSAHTILVAMLFSVSCGNPVADEDTSGFAEGYLFDIDGDGEPDVEVEYIFRTTHDVPASTVETTGRIVPLGNHEIFYRDSAGHLLSEGYLLQANPGSNGFWNGYGADVITRRNKQKTWTILSDEPGAYFIGFKLKDGNMERMGWALLEFDTRTGAITFKAVKLVNDDEGLVGM